MLKRIFIFITIIMINFILISSIEPNALTDSNLINNNKISNVAVLLYSFNDSFMLRLKQNLENIQKENPEKVKFTFFDGKNNISIQNETLDSLIKENFNLIIANLADISEEAVVGVVDKVKQKNIPLILLEVDPDVAQKVSKAYDKVVSVLPNSQQAGINQGKIIVNLWNTNKKIIDKNGDNIMQYVMLTGEVDNIIAKERTKYSIDTINNAGIKTDQIAIVNANWFEDLARESVENLFLRYNGNIEAIIANNDAMSIGAIKALQKYGYNKGDKSKYVVVVGMGGQPEAKELIDEGIMYGTVIQDPKDASEALYNIGMNLINNLSPVENTNYKLKNGVVSIELPYNEYVNKSNV